MIDAPRPINRYAEMIDDAARRSRSELCRSSLGHREALEDLWGVWNNRQPDWDRFEALAVEQGNICDSIHAHRFFAAGLSASVDRG